MVFLPHFPISSARAISSDSAQKLRPILAKLGNPQNNIPPIIHIAGTNGKGSVAAFLSSIFQAANYKTHIFTSPHLHHCNERIKINGQQISDNYLYELLEEIRFFTQNIDLTLFEGMFLAAILAFSKNPADICIIETGMGGKVDATNALDNKIATILTSISLDHEEFLGNNLPAIAAHKAHIARTKTPCIIAPQNISAGQIIDLHCLQIKTSMVHFGQNFTININENDFDFKYLGDNLTINYQKLPKPNLIGRHQYLNASLAIAAICAIKDLQKTNFNIDQKAAEEGLKKAFMPSRLQKLNYRKLKAKDELFIDGAHNFGGFSSLALWLKEKMVEDYEKKEIKRNYLIVGFSKNKSKPEIFRLFKDIMDFICPVMVEGEPDPEETGNIAKNIAAAQIEQFKTKENLDDALNFLINLDQKNPCRIIICGSFYLARDFRKLSNQ